MSRPIGLRPMPASPAISILSRESIGGGTIARMAGTTPATGTSPWSDAANSLIAFPFVIDVDTTFYKGFWVNGSAAGSNGEVGIWDASYNKIVTTGSVAGSGNSVPQSSAFASSATPKLPPGLYYAGMAWNATTTNRLCRFGGIPITGFWQVLGCWKQAGITLGSLAATATPGDITNAVFPYFGVITRTVFDL